VVFFKKKRKNLASGFESEKQAVFGQTRLFFEFDPEYSGSDEKNAEVLCDALALWPKN
jgi:hypothetical protein